MPEQPRYVYISTKASIDPVKTVIVFPPADQARTVGDAESFARRSGWVDAVEDDASVLMVAVAGDGWDACPADMPMRLYQENRRSFKAVGTGSAAAGGSLWAWETLIYLVGYGDGATFAGNYQLSCPGFAAASVLVDGSADALGALDEPSEHWLVNNPSDYNVKNRDIPIAAWFMGTGSAQAMLDHAIAVDAAEPAGDIEVAGHPTRVLANPENAGMQIRVTPGLTGEDPVIANAGMDFFCRVIRWKNGPDGSLAPRRTKDEFCHDGTYLHDEVIHGGERYHYAVYLPKGFKRAQARNLSLVISIHGRGEPTWIFAEKNGWERLADETRAFVVMLPDSPGNVWSEERDAPALAKMVEQTIDSFGLCRERTFITGFSNGAVFTCQMASLYPSSSRLRRRGTVRALKRSFRVGWEDSFLRRASPTPATRSRSGLLPAMPMIRRGSSQPKMLTWCSPLTGAAARRRRSSIPRRSMLRAMGTRRASASTRSNTATTRVSRWWRRPV